MSTSVRVLVVDDSVVIRRLVTDLLQADPDIEVVGTAVNGQAALQKVELLSPDVITMDIEMPVMDGIQAVRALRAQGVATPIVMFSTLSERGATATLDALAAGATDYVTKPANVGSVHRSMETVSDSLVPKIKALGARRPLTTPRPSARPDAPATPLPPSLERSSSEPYRLLVIGSSTGGPEALHSVLSTLPVLPVPVAVVQHMPPVFTEQFAKRLDRSSAWDVSEVQDGQLVLPGQVVIARGDHHLELVSTHRGFRAKTSQGPQENYCRPAVDVLFRSAATAAGAGVLALVLTGMGQDGERGADVIVRRGGSVLAQDRETSVVWGMPGAVTQAGLAEQVLPLHQVGSELTQRLSPTTRTSRRPVPALEVKR